MVFFRHPKIRYFSLVHGQVNWKRLLVRSTKCTTRTTRTIDFATPGCDVLSSANVMYGQQILFCYDLFSGHPVWSPAQQGGSDSVPGSRGRGRQGWRQGGVWWQGEDSLDAVVFINTFRQSRPQWGWPTVSLCYISWVQERLPHLLNYLL